MKNDEHTMYEKLVQEIYQALHKAEGLGTTNISHNVKLLGKSGCRHQIDVYWEFERVGELYRVAIECKNYTGKVEIRNVRDFFGVLYDIGSIKGVLVTKVGYDSGAPTFADYYNISLKEVRFPEAKDWDGRLKTIDLGLTPFGINITNRSLSLDAEWLLRNGKIKTGDTEFLFSLPNDSEQDICIYSSIGEKITDFYQMKCELLGMHMDWKEQYELKHTFSFEDGFIDTVESGRVKVNHIEFTYDYISASQKVLIEGEEIAKAIIKDVKTGNIKLIDKDGNVRE